MSMVIIIRIAATVPRRPLLGITSPLRRADEGDECTPVPPRATVSSQWPPHRSWIRSRPIYSSGTGTIIR